MRRDRVARGCGRSPRPVASLASVWSPHSAWRTSGGRCLMAWLRLRSQVARSTSPLPLRASPGPAWREPKARGKVTPSAAVKRHQGRTEPRLSPFVVFAAHTWVANEASSTLPQFICCTVVLVCSAQVPMLHSLNAQGSRSVGGVRESCQNTRPS